MAKKKPTQVGVSLEGVVYRTELPLLLKPWLHATELASAVVSVTVYPMSNPTTLFESGSRTNIRSQARRFT